MLATPPHGSEKFVDVERFAKLGEDVFILELVHGTLRGRGDDNHAFLTGAVIFQGLQHVETRARSHHQVEHDGVVSLDLDSADGFMAVGCLLDLESLPTQDNTNEITDSPIVIDDQDARLGHSSSSMRPNREEGVT